MTVLNLKDNIREYRPNCSSSVNALSSVVFVDKTYQNENVAKSFSQH